MNNIQSFESFTGNAKSEKVNESIPFGSYYFNSRTEFGEHSDNLPEKGETKYLVFAHNSADFNGQTIKLQGEIRMGSATSKNIIAIFDDEETTANAYRMAMRKPKGTFVSFSMGTYLQSLKLHFNTLKLMVIKQKLK
jgi:hypothetical protein